jgi:hypothetical protein
MFTPEYSNALGIIQLNTSDLPQNKSAVFSCISGSNFLLGKRNETEKTEKFLKRNETERKENVKVMKRNGTKRNSSETKRNEISVKR